MSFNALGLEAVLSSLQDDPDMASLFGGQDTVDKIKHSQKLQGEARRKVALALASIYASPDGEILFEYLIGAYIRRFNNVTAMGLPMETAIQLHAERDGQKELVYDLLRMINEGRGQPNDTSNA